jgi:predicted PurR-regulated permease PerM
MGRWLAPFVISLVLAYALHAPSLWISKRFKISTSVSAMIVVSVIILLVSFFAIFLIPLLKNAGVVIIQKLPRLLRTLPDMVNGTLDSILAPFGVSRSFDVGFNMQDCINRLTTIWPSYIPSFIDTGMTLIHSVIFIFMIPIITFYLLRDWEKLQVSVKTILQKLVPSSVIDVISDLNVKLAVYVRGQLLICFILSTCYGTCLYFIGITEYIVCGFLSGFLSAAPFFGPCIGLVITSAMAIDDYSSILQYVLTCGLYAAIPLIDSNFLTSRLIGRSTGVHPVWLLFSICATASMFGTLGVFVSVPAAVVLSTVCKAAFKKFSSE